VKCDRLQAGRALVAACVLAFSCNTAWATPQQDVQLLQAAAAQDPETALYALSAGADARATEADGTTALHYAARAGHADVVASLLARGAAADAKAKNGDTAALIWWTKAQMKWTETQRHENTGSDGGPVEIVIKWSEGK
jgi:euchromatic histone-lysine N-methyltransferase